MKAVTGMSKEDTRRKINLPNKNEDLAEFIGILTGDGYIGQYKLTGRIVSSIEISGNKLKDYDYMKNFVTPLLKKLFNLDPHFYPRNDQNTLRLIIYSKSLVGSINKLGFPMGNKGNISPPKWILDNDLLFKRYIRGFFDTDGCFLLKNKEGKKYPVANMASKSRPLLESIKTFLSKFGISSYLGKRTAKDLRFKKESIVYKLEINGRKNIALFYQLIGSNNSRNKIKYDEIA
jgi:intein/homing endonuclease